LKIPKITKERNHKRAAHHSIPAFRWELVKNTLRSQRKDHKRAAHHSIPALGGIGRTVEKYLKTKHKERNHKRAAHHQSLL
jgi:hypothetical protein